MDKALAKPINQTNEPASPVHVDELDPDLTFEVAKKSGTRSRDCLSCLTCSSGCPFYSAMDYGPHGIMRRVNYGLRREVLESNTIWLCVGCHTCSSCCPMGIDIASVMDALRNIALKEGVRPAEPNVLAFHREVLNSIQRYGRTHKLEIMLRYKLQSGTWLKDVGVGLKMMAKHKLDLMPSKIEHPEKLAGLFGPVWRGK